MKTDEAAASSYRENLAWLYSLQKFGIKLGLEPTRRLIAELKAEPREACVIHVAGTNGKGSVCAMIESIARAAGYRTGFFTSPHLVSFRERIQVSGRMIWESEVASILNEIRDFTKDWETTPTFFEITTALALKHFANKRVSVIVLETGMGGRLDSTNAVQSTVSVITPIGLDHQKWLGNSLAEIASEKAGIIKPQTPVISALQEPEAMKVIEARAKECEAPLQVVEAPYEAGLVGLRGAHQKMNAALAVEAINAAEVSVDEAHVGRGLASVDWPARFQFWDKRTIIDGAHNPAAARILAEAWREMFAQKGATIVFGVLADKNVREILEPLVPLADRFILPPVRSVRAMEPKEIALILKSISPSLPCTTTSTIAEALDQARAGAELVLVTGSLHFAGEVLAHLRGEPAAYEECAQ